MFEVISGTFDGNEPNLKYQETFDSFEEAFTSFKRESNRVWSALYFGSELVKGFDPFAS